MMSLHLLRTNISPTIAGTFEANNFPFHMDLFPGGFLAPFSLKENLDIDPLIH